jgi:hypothetical protein
LPAAVPLSASIEESFTRRLQDLPDDTRLLLLLAAAEPVAGLADQVAFADQDLVGLCRFARYAEDVPRLLLAPAPKRCARRT